MELPIRKKNRLADYDYSAPNAYFITICTQNRKNIFWPDVGAAIGRPQDLSLTHYGFLAKQCILDIPNRYPSISLDHYVIMPNHIHLLLQIKSGDDGRPMAAPTISTVINQVKGAITKQIGFPIWQKGFHDHVVRGKNDYLEIWNYIEGNPSQWLADTLHPQNHT